MMKVNKGKRDIRTGEKKKKRTGEQNADVETHVTVNHEVDHGMQVIKEKKGKVSTNRKRKNKDKNLVGRQRPEDEVDLEEQNVDHGMQVIKEKKGKVSTNRKRKNKDKNLVGRQRPEGEVDPEELNVDHGMQVMKEKKGEVSTYRKRKNKDKNLVGRQRPEDEVDLEEQNDVVLDNCHSKAEEIKDSKDDRDSNIGAAIKPCRSKKAKKKRKKEIQNSPEKGEYHEDEIHIISSGDDDCSNGMKKWIIEYHRGRPGLEVLQHQIDDFVTAYEEKLEEEGKAKEALAAEGGWTVVIHHKGRKKTTDSESGIAVGSVAQAAVENKLAQKKRKEVGLDFYRFQKREAQRNEIMLLQGKFEEDKKRLQQLRAARKFRPY